MHTNRPPRQRRQPSTLITLLFSLALASLGPLQPVAQAWDVPAQDLFTVIDRLDARAALDLLEQNPANALVVDEQGNTPLHQAVAKRQAFIVELLLEYGADETLKNKQGKIPLEMLPPARPSEYVSNRRVVNAFVRHHSHQQQGSQQRRAQLRFLVGVRSRDTDLARAAVSEGADPNAPVDALGNTLMHTGVWSEMFPVLIELGADLERVNKRGESPLTVTLRRADVFMARALLASGAELTVNETTSDLLYVIRSRSKASTTLVDLLLDAGAPVRHDEWMAAMASRNGDVVRELLKHSPFDAASPEGEELVAQAVRLGGESVMAELREDPEIAAYLVKRDTRLNKSRDRELTEFGSWLAPHIFALAFLIAAFALLSCLPARILFTKRWVFFAAVGISAAIMTHLFVFTPVIKMALSDFRFFGERVPWLPHFAYLVFDGAAVLVGLLVAGLTYGASKEWRARPLVATVLIVAYAAGIGLLAAHHAEAITWPTVLYQRATGYDDDIAREEQLKVRRREKLAARAKEDSESRSREPHFPLFEAVLNNDPTEVRAVLEGGLPVDTRNESGDTALFVAIGGGHYDVIPALLDTGADPNALHKRGMRPVHQVFSRGVGAGNQALLQQLIEAGADINARTDAGGTPLCSAHRDKHTATTHALFMWLLSQGASLKYSDRCAESAYAKKPVFFLPLLAETAQNIDRPTHFGELDDQFGMYEATPLWQAAYRRKLDMVRLLLDLGADVDARDTQRGMTPLQIVVEGSQYRADNGRPFIDVLLSHGADPNAVAWDGTKTSVRP